MRSNLIDRFVTLSLTIVSLAGCVTTPTASKQPITELYQSIYEPSYDFVPAQQQDKPVGYTIGIINMNFTTESVQPNSWAIVTPLEKQYIANFVSAFSGGLEKILMSKGMTVSGPFESYEEMTYPQRSRCTFLVQPTVSIVFQPTLGTIEDLPEHGGPQGENWKVGQCRVDLKSQVKLEYLILDSLTAEKLERHTLKTDSLDIDYLELYASYVTKRDDYGNVLERKWERISADSEFPPCHNGEIAVGRIVENLFKLFMPQIDSLVSVEEFDHLMKYKKELEEKKVY